MGLGMLGNRMTPQTLRMKVSRMLPPFCPKLIEHKTAPFSLHQ
jgi:hypothetical protein